MKVKHVAAATAIAAGVGAGALTGGTGLVSAAPLDPPPCPNCQPDPAVPRGIPAQKCWAYGRVGPGSPIGGGGQPLYPPPCKAPAQAGGG